MAHFAPALHRPSAVRNIKNRPRRDGFAQLLQAAALSVGAVWKKSHNSCTLDGGGQLSLMLGAGAGHTAGHNLAALGYKAAKLCSVLVVYALNLIGTELANLSAGLAAGSGLSGIFLLRPIIILLSSD